MAKLLDFSKAETYADRVKVIADSRKHPAKDVDEALAALERGDAADALCAVKVAAVARSPGSGAALLRLLGHPSPHVMCAAARATIRTVNDDAAVVARFPELTMAAQRRLLQVLRTRRGPDGARRAPLARLLLPEAKKALGAAAAGSLLKVAPPEDAASVPAAVAVHVKWHVLALARPDLAAQRVEAVAEAAEPEALCVEALDLFPEALWRNLATAKNKEPVLRLLRSNFRFSFSMKALSGMRPLLKAHAAEIAPLLVRAQQRENLSDKLEVFMRRRHLQRLPSPYVGLIGCAVRKMSIDLLAKMLKALPSRGRASLLEAVRREGPLNIAMHERKMLLKQLRGEQRVAEARLMLTGDMPKEERLELMAHLPWAEAEKELTSASRVPNEMERGNVAKLQVMCAWRSGDVTPALQWIVQKMRTEKGHVRWKAVSELRNALYLGLLQDAHIPLLKQAVAHYVQQGRNDEESNFGWCALVRETLLRALRTGTQDSALASWALAAVSELRWTCGDDELSRGWAGACQTNYPDSVDQGFKLLMSLFGYCKTMSIFDVEVCCYGFERLEHAVNQTHCDHITPERLQWTWEKVATPLIEAARVRAQREDAEDCHRAEYWDGMAAIGELLARRPQRMLFTSPVLKPLLDQLLGAIEPESFAVVEAASVGGEGGAPAPGPPPLTSANARNQLVRLFLADSETRERIVEALRRQPALLPMLARGLSPTSLGRTHEWSTIGKLMALRPDLLLPAFLTVTPETETMTESDKEAWPGQKPLPPLYRVKCYSRWSPKEQQAFLEKWLLPLSEQTDCADHGSGSQPQKRPPSVGECALKMMARLTFAQPVLPHLEAACAKHSATLLELTMKQKAAADKAVAVAGAGEAEGGEEDDGDVCVDAARLNSAQGMATAAAVAMGQSLQGPAAALPAVREAAARLPGEAGKIAVKSLRRAASFEHGGGYTDVLQLLEKKDLPIGVRKELMRSLGTAGRLDALESLWADDAHRDVRIAILTTAASFAGEDPVRTLKILARAAGTTATAEPLAENGAEVALTFAKLARKLDLNVLPPEQCRLFVSDVLGPQLRLPPNTRNGDVRQETLEAYKVWIMASGLVGDAPEVLAPIAAAAGALARDAATSWAQRRAAIQVVVSCGSTASAEVQACVRSFQASLASQETWAHGARLLRLILTGFQEVARLRRGLPAGHGAALAELMPLLSEDLAPLVLGTKLLLCPWESVETLPAKLAEVCGAAQPWVDEELCAAVAETLGAIPATQERRAALLAAVDALLAASRPCRLAASAVLEVVAKDCGWKGAAREQLARLFADEDAAVRLRAKWLAVRRDNKMDSGEVED